MSPTHSPSSSTSGGLELHYVDLAWNDPYRGGVVAA